MKPPIHADRRRCDWPRQRPLRRERPNSAETICVHPRSSAVSGRLPGAPHRECSAGSKKRAERSGEVSARNFETPLRLGGFARDKKYLGTGNCEPLVVSCAASNPILTPSRKAAKNCCCQVSAQGTNDREHLRQSACICGFNLRRSICPR